MSINSLTSVNTSLIRSLYTKKVYILVRCAVEFHARKLFLGKEKFIYTTIIIIREGVLVSGVFLERGPHFRSVLREG